MGLLEILLKVAVLEGAAPYRKRANRVFPETGIGSRPSGFILGAIAEGFCVQGVLGNTEAKMEGLRGSGAAESLGGGSAEQWSSSKTIQHGVARMRLVGIRLIVISECVSFVISYQ